MATSIDQAFVKQFEREVHEAYQRQGAKLKGAVRTINNVKGATAVFQRVGKGKATTKSRNSAVPVMNMDRSAIECELKDYYAGDWVDKLDELKVNHDERQVIANAGAYALGRKTDELIIDALNSASENTVSAGSAGLTKNKILEAFEMLGEQDIPDDGQRFAVIGWRQYSDLLDINEFASADYVGSDNLPFKGITQAKQWLGTTWIPHSGLPVNSNIRSCFWFHKTAVGHASGADVQTDITWQGYYAAHFINNMMSQGACLVDDSGVVTLEADETA